VSTDTSVPAQRVSGLGVSDSALLETLLREAPIGFAFFDTGLRFRRVNRTLARLHGVDHSVHLGRQPSEVWPADLAAKAEAALRRVLATGQPVLEADQAVAAADGLGLATGRGAAGRERHWAFSWFPCHDGHTNVTGVVLIAADITDRQHSAEAVRRSEARYRSLVQAGAQVVWVTTPAGEVAEDSPEWRWITGQTLEEYLGSGWLDAIHPEDRDRVERAWRECVRTGKTFDNRYRMRTKAGAYRHYDVRAVPIERAGKIIEWVGASTDVTGQREAEEMRGRLTEQLSAAALRTARLQQATSMLAEALTVEQVVEVITEVGRSAVGAERSSVALLDQERLRLHTVDPGGQSAAIPLDMPGVITAAVNSRKPVLIADPEELRRQFEPDASADLYLRHTDEQAWVALPLLAAGSALGAIRFSFTRPRRITEEERVFLEALAGQCALAVERASLFEREHTTAETLQRSLLPDRLPIVPGIILEARYLPVTRNMEIGGDWYDAFKLPDGRLAIAAGDVMGKGLTAAAGMGRVRNALRALALTDPRPAAVLAGLDRLFNATELDEQVTTVAYLVVDPATGEGLAGNAGHLPPLRLRPNAPPRLDEIDAGTPLGWASPRQQHAFRLPPSNTVVFYSDGLVENRMRGLDAGLDELLSVASQAAPEVIAHPDRLLEYLVDRMLAGYEQDDDVTVLVLHVPEHDRGGEGLRRSTR
jgi:PAS domain S-box-containing protein